MSQTLCAQTGNDFANSIRNNPANQSHLHASEGQQAFVGNRETHFDGEDGPARNGILKKTATAQTTRAILAVANRGRQQQNRAIAMQTLQGNPQGHLVKTSRPLLSSCVHQTTFMYVCPGSLANWWYFSSRRSEMAIRNICCKTNCRTAGPGVSSPLLLPFLLLLLLEHCPKRTRRSKCSVQITATTIR